MLFFDGYANIANAIFMFICTNSKCYFYSTVVGTLRFGCVTCKVGNGSGTRWCRSRRPALERQRRIDRTESTPSKSSSSVMDMKQHHTCYELHIGGARLVEARSKLEEQKDTMDLQDFAIQLKELTHKCDYMFVMRDDDDSNEIVGFRSTKYNASIGSWVFENGVVRDKGNALGRSSLPPLLTSVPIFRPSSLYSFIAPFLLHFSRPSVISFCLHLFLFFFPVQITAPSCTWWH